MAYQKVQDAAVAIGDGSIFHPLIEGSVASQTGKCRAYVSIADTATVIFKGRVHPDAAWETIDTSTSTEGVELTAYTDMKAEITVWSAGAVNVWVQF